MDNVGTLIIRRQWPHAASNPIYAVQLISAPSRRESPAYRCPGDVALLRALEELLPNADLRLHTLEHVRGEGEARVPGIIVSEALLYKYGFAKRARREAWVRSDRATAGEELLCAVCSRPTTANDRLTMLSGEVIHFECRPESRDLPEITARFLNDSPGRAFCHSCLAGLLRISFEEARKIVGQLRVRTGFGLETGRCAGCGRFRVTISKISE